MPSTGTTGVAELSLLLKIPSILSRFYWFVLNTRFVILSAYDSGSRIRNFLLGWNIMLFLIRVSKKQSGQLNLAWWSCIVSLDAVAGISDNNASRHNLSGTDVRSSLLGKLMLEAWNIDIDSVINLIYKLSRITCFIWKTLLEKAHSNQFVATIPYCRQTFFETCIVWSVGVSRWLTTLARETCILIWLHQHRLSVRSSVQSTHALRDKK